jgi:hypothetical protein
MDRLKLRYSAFGKAGSISLVPKVTQGQHANQER